MENYIAQLIEDLHAAKSIIITQPYIELDKDQEKLRGTMEYMEGPLIVFEQVFKIDRACFPTAQRLSDAQMVCQPVLLIKKCWRNGPRSCHM